MKILVDVKDSKANFLMELLSSISFVKKAEPLKKQEKLSVFAGGSYQGSVSGK